MILREGVLKRLMIPLMRWEMRLFMQSMHILLQFASLITQLTYFQLSQHKYYLRQDRLECGSDSQITVNNCIPYFQFVYLPLSNNSIMNSNNHNWSQMLKYNHPNPYLTTHLPPPPTTPPQNTLFSRPINTIMYSSAIQPQTPLMHPQSQSLLAFERMGRFVKDQIEEDLVQHPVKGMNVAVKAKGEPLSFRKGRDHGGKKMSSSSIFPSHKTASPNIPAIGKNKENVAALSKLQALMGNKKILEAQEEYFTEPQHNSRKRQINSLVQEGTKIAIKLENQSTRVGGSKIYFQLPSRKKQNQPQGSLLKQPYGQINSNIPSQGMFNKKTIFYAPQVKQRETLKKSDFAFGKKVGKGQFGEVMMAIHKLTGFLCGLKVMSKKQIREQKYVEQIVRQLKIQFYLEHRYIAPLYGYFQDKDSIYLLVQFCTEGQLFQKMRLAHQLEEEEVAPIVREVCQGLRFIHEGQIIHRDIKPQNILFQFGTVKISDFGWAVHANNQMRRTVSGTPLYYSPELVLEKHYDEKIDIWSVGMMTYECLLGRIPFRIYSQFDLKRIVEDEITYPQYVDISLEAKDFILKTMKKNPEQRIEVIDMLRHPFLNKHREQGLGGHWEQLGRVMGE